ncbi:hypothetical protein [Bartonella florencae]|uniref:hypothetical protein n=1 Tax=Bartonella florencae TaxID=928210 RepID=UPI001FCAE389|nr:hypothetical protein [Bartonella florencae]
MFIETSSFVFEKTGETLDKIAPIEVNDRTLIKGKREDFESLPANFVYNFFIKNSPMKKITINTKKTHLKARSFF